MEPLAKKLKCDQSSESEPNTFLYLNDHCIYLILKKNSPEDLYSISLTCKKLYNMAHETIRLYHQSEYLPISIIQDHTPGKFRIEVKHYSRSFSKLIPNISITLEKFRWFAPIDINLKIMVYRFIKSNCAAELKSIWLNSSVIIDSTISETIQDQLNSVKVLKIHYLSNADDVYDGLLKHCKNIECIDIYLFDVRRFYTRFGEEPNAIGWFHHEYPKLKLLQFSLMNANGENDQQILVKSLNAFFNQDPNFKDITPFGTEVIEAMKNAQLTVRIWNEDPLSHTLTFAKRFRKFIIKK